MEAHKETKRRDQLIDIEKRVQESWDKNQVFEVDPPKDGAQEKWLGTFPYPYMNGVLHLGHAFTLSKVEFAARYQRLKGKRVLFPFGFHCTGMPIVACAEKLKREFLEYGYPPIFPTHEPESAVPAEGKSVEPVNKAKSKKGKLGKKKSKENTQYGIMREMGVEESTIHLFRDPTHWLSYFPPIGVEHLKKFGVCVDFRRSFITTDKNPYYDAFIRWQFMVLKRMGKLEFGKRNSIFSPKDNQVCADHERASGEQVQPQEYTLVKLQLLPPYPNCEALANLPQNVKVFLPAATLRPETMYGQTNLFVLPEGSYGVYLISPDTVFVTSHRSALNMSFQEITPVRGKPHLLGEVLGETLIGCAVKAPLAVYEKVYVLPLMTIKMDKGTGVVTSVPSDAPDDWAALMDLKNKPKLREKFHLKDHMVLPFDIVPIIHTPGLGNTPAADLCIQEKVQSQNDTEKLAAIKEKVYTEGFYKGEMLVGLHKGKKVSEAKSLIKQMLIEQGLALSYSEPENKVVARSGEECVVALTDQWYLKYGDPHWKALVEAHLAKTLQTFNPIAHKAFEDTLGWLHEWACSREFGLGTKLPFDVQFVIESLSDSTIYMAYYTIAHFLQGDLNGEVPGTANLKPSQLTEEVFNYIFLKSLYPEYPSACGIERAVVEEMRAEFEYWYPVDLRVSGKDLIGNHLTMALYNHAAIWEHDSGKWPRALYTNGHLMINGDKMSKSTGNFLTMEDAIIKFGVDATRVALADAGDGLMDANFAADTANSAILRLTKEEAWIREVLLESPELLRDGPAHDFMDLVFENEMNICIAKTEAAYSSMRFHDALVSCFFDLWNARDDYRTNTTLKLHRGLVVRFVEVAVVMLSPVCPHWTQHMWNLIGKKGYVLDAAWPHAQPENTLLSKKIRYLRDAANSFRSLLNKQKAGPKKGKGKEPEAEYNAVSIVVAPEYPAWQRDCLQRLHAIHLDKGKLPDNRELAGILKDVFADKKLLKNAMAFCAQIMGDFEARGVEVLQVSMDFDEKEFVTEHKHFLTRGMDMAEVKIVVEEEGQAIGKPATPGKPKAIFSRV